MALIRSNFAIFRRGYARNVALCDGNSIGRIRKFAANAFAPFVFGALGI